MSTNLCIFVKKDMKKVGRPRGSQKYHISDYVGKKINKWTVLSYSHRTDDRNLYWNVSCECGREQPVRVRQLINGQSKGCRYCRPQSKSRDLSPWWSSSVDFSIGWYNSREKNAIKRGFAWNLDPNYLQNLIESQDYLCAYSGEKLYFDSNSRAVDGTASIDRIDNSIGYLKGNVHLVHKEVNFMKGALSERRFLDLCRKVSRI